MFHIHMPKYRKYVGDIMICTAKKTIQTVLYVITIRTQKLSTINKHCSIVSHHSMNVNDELWQRGRQFH